MAIIERLFPIYFVFLWIRLLIPDTGQMTFSQPYQFVVKLTRPVLSFLEKAFPPRARSFSPILALVLLVFFQGLIYTGGERSERVFGCGFAPWIFITDETLWGVGKSLVFYLVFLYQLYAFLLIVALLSPLMDSANQVSRVVKRMLPPLEKWRRVRWLGLLVLFGAFSLLLALVRIAYQSINLLIPQEMILVKSVFSSAALIIRLLSVLLVLIFLRVIFSWFALFRSYSGPVSWLELFTEPFLKPFRRLGLTVGGLDLTPVVAIFAFIMTRKVSLLLLSVLYNSIER